MIKISENKCNICRHFRPCQKMAYHWVSKPYLYTVFTEIFAIKCTYLYKLLLFRMFLVNPSRNFPSFHAYRYAVHKQRSFIRQDLRQESLSQIFSSMQAEALLGQQKRTTFGCLHVYTHGLRGCFATRLKLLNSGLNKKIKQQLHCSEKQY